MESDALDRESRTSWLLLLDWGVVALTVVSAGASALAAVLAFRNDDTSAMAEAVLACGAAAGAAWLGKRASRAAKLWQEELVAWHGNDIVLLTDERGRILDANDRAVEAYGLPLDVLFHKPVQELRHANADGGFERHLDELRANGHAIFETIHRRPDGARLPIEVSARVVRMRGHRNLHFVCRDVTESHLARKRLVAAERLAAVGTLAAGVAHDVNNPLCSVLGNLSYAVDSLDDEKPDLCELRTALAEARESAARVRDIVRELSAYVDACRNEARAAGTPPPALPMQWSPRAGLAAAMGILSPAPRAAASAGPDLEPAPAAEAARPAAKRGDA